MIGVLIVIGVVVAIALFIPELLAKKNTSPKYRPSGAGEIDTGATDGTIVPPTTEHPK